jgi:hypothetical protein
MRRPSWALGAGVLALALAPAPALAGDPSGGLLDQVQKAGNVNSTTQRATSTATTKQANVNVPVSVLSKDANNGDVRQSNDAQTSASSSNDNATRQGVGQSQNGSGSASRGGSVKQDQSGSNGNSTDQRARSKGTSKQANVNVPVSVLSKGANNGDVRQSNHAKTEARSSNGNATKQHVDQSQNGTASGGSPERRCCESRGGSVKQHQSGSNDNSTDQKADSKATTEQANVNAPIAFASGRKKHTCGCDGHDRGRGRDRRSEPGKRPGEECRCGGYDRRPFSGGDERGQGRDRGHGCGCDDGHGGDVEQSNDARTSASSANDNATMQDLGQSQDGSASGSRGGPTDQRQEGSNTNETKQEAKSEAKTEQVNLNVPISFLSEGSNGGDVAQSNDAWTSADSWNGNATKQDLDQSQTASAFADDCVGRLKGS